MVRLVFKPFVPRFHRREPSALEEAKPGIWDAHDDVAVLEILDARALHNPYEETAGAGTPGGEARAAVGRAGAALPPHHLVATIPRRMFADSIRRRPAHVLLGVCDAPLLGQHAVFA